MARLNWNPPKLPSRLTAEYIWDPVDPESGFHYAALVHNGARLKPGKLGSGISGYGTRVRTYPARPWAEWAVQNTDLVGAFVEKFQGSDSLEKAFRHAADLFLQRQRDGIAYGGWYWYNETFRKSGEYVPGPGPRNSIDLGNLYRSGRYELQR